MSKKSITIIASIVAFVTVFVIIAILFMQNQSEYVEIPSMNAVPLDASLIVECKQLPNSFNELNTKNKLWQALKKFKSFHRVENNIRFIDSLISSNVKLQNLFAQRSLIFSTHLSGKDEVEFLYIIKLGKPLFRNNIEDVVKQLVQKDIAISEYKYDGEVVYKLSYESTTTRVSENQKKTFFYSFCNGFFICSHNRLLVESSIRQLHSGKPIHEDESFKKVAKAAGQNVAANVYLHYKDFAKLLSLFTANKYMKRILKLSDFADWTELDAIIKNDELLLNGFTYTSLSDKNYLNIFRNQTPASHEFTSVIPDITSLFVALNINRWDLFQENYKKHLKYYSAIDLYNQKISAVNKKYNTNIEKLFFSFLGNEAAVVFTGTATASREKQCLGVFKTKSKSMAKNELMKILETYTKQQNQHISKYIKLYEPDDETAIPIYKMPENKLLPLLFGRLFQPVEANYFTFVDNYLIFGNSFKELADVHYANLLNKVLSKSLAYKQFANSLSSESNIFLFMNFMEAPGVIASFTNHTITHLIDNNYDVYREFYALAIQFSVSNDLIYTNLSLKYQPVTQNNNNTVWESRLDTAMNFKPELFTNHYTNEKEIFVQDLANTIYLINKSGRILWKKQLNEPIISTIYEFDYYKNNKLQLLFNTRSAIHLIDRNGNYVVGYPKQLPAPATNGISLFDYNKNKDYRIFVACSNRRIYAYNRDGSAVNGWSFEQTEHKVTNQIQHFRVNSNDYIVFADKFKTYLLNRKGYTRTNIKTTFEKSKHNAFTLDVHHKGSLSEPRIVTTGATGVVYCIYFNGIVTSTDVTTCSIDHYFEYQDINGDGYKDYIFLDKNRLSVFDQSKKELFNYAFEYEPHLPPVIYTFSSDDRKIGITLHNQNKIYLLNGNGTMYPGFPLGGQTLFTIGKFTPADKNFHLIVGNSQNFVFNYKIKN